jgi:hypothetical protein
MDPIKAVLIALHHFMMTMLTVLALWRCRRSAGGKPMTMQPARAAA